MIWRSILPSSGIHLIRLPLCRYCSLLYFAVVLAGSLSACTEPITEYAASDLRFATLVGKRHGPQINSAGQAGFLVFGPYVELPAGSYRLLARGVLTGAAGAPLPLGVLDVAGYKGTRIYVSRPLYGDEQAGEGNIAAVFFDLPKAVTDVEFRIQITAAASAVFRGYDLSKVSSFP